MSEQLPGSVSPRPLPRVIAVANQKGGVGKTTTVVNLGACLAELGYRTLIIDLDPQGNASTGVGINEERRRDMSIYHVLIDDEMPLEDAMFPTEVPNLFIVPASLDLAAAEVELRSGFAAELYLRAAFERSAADFDFVLIDCPPSFGVLTTNGLAAAQEVLIPIQCEYYALEGTGQLLVTLDKIRKKLNRSLELTTIVCVMYDARTNLADKVVEVVRENFGDKVCKTVIPRTVRLSEAPELGQPIVLFDSSSRGALAYRELAREVSGGATPRHR